MYSRSYIRTSIGGVPQYPYRRRQDIDSYMTPMDVSLILAKFSQFYQQRILPEEVYQFFIRNNSDTDDIDFTKQIDFSKIMEQAMQNVKVTKHHAHNPRKMIKFEGIDDKDKHKETELEDVLAGNQTNPLIKLYQDYAAVFLK